MPSGIKIDNVSRTIFIKSATNILSAFLPTKKYTVGVPFRACFIRLVFQIRLRPVTTIILEF